MLALHDLRKGSGVPVVFLHGFLGRSSDYLPIVKYMEGFHCIGVDLPGHGDSPFTEHFDIPLPYFHLVAYSMGGRLSLRIDEKKIASLTLISTHPGLQTEEEKSARWQSDLEWAKLLHDLPMEQFLKKWYAQDLFGGFYAPRLKQNKKELIASFLHYSLAKQTYTPLDYVLVGERDQKFRSLFKHPVLIHNAAHAAHLQNPEQVACILTSNIKKRTGSQKLPSTALMSATPLDR